MNTNRIIKSYRNQLCLSQERVANYLGISRATYAQMEEGYREITEEDISKLSDLFGVSADVFSYENKFNQPTTEFANSHCK